MTLLLCGGGAGAGSAAPPPPASLPRRRFTPEARGAAGGAATASIEATRNSIGALVRDPRTRVTIWRRQVRFDFRQIIRGDGRRPYLPNDDSPRVALIEPLPVDEHTLC